MHGGNKQIQTLNMTDPYPNIRPKGQKWRDLAQTVNKFNMNYDRHLTQWKTAVYPTRLQRIGMFILYIMAITDEHWTLKPPEKIWGPNGNQFANDIISGRSNMVITMTDWMDPKKLATLGIKDDTNYGWKFTTNSAMYVFTPTKTDYLKVKTYTDNLTFQITKRNTNKISMKEAPLQYGFSSVSLHEYITPEKEMPEQLKIRLLRDGFTIHYGIIPFEEHGDVDREKRIEAWRHDSRQISTGVQNYIQRHKSATVSPTIIPQMDIRCNITPSGKIGLKIQGTQLGKEAYTLLYIWILPVEDRDYDRSIKLLQRQQDYLSREADKNAKAIEVTTNKNIKLSNDINDKVAKQEQEIKKGISDTQGILGSIDITPQLNTLETRLQKKIDILDHKIQMETTAIQSQLSREITEELAKHVISEHQIIKEISYYVKGKPVDRP